MKKEFLTYKFGVNWYDIMKTMYPHLKDSTVEDILKT